MAEGQANTSESRGIKLPSLDAVWPIAFACAFWAIIILLVILAVAKASDKGNPFTDFFVAFGAVGQVAFAYMVWRLGREQFHFTKKVARRQALIDTYEHRTRIFERFVEIRKNLYLHRISEEGVWELTALGRELRRLFSHETIKLFDALEDQAWLLQEANEELSQAQEATDRAAAKAARDKRTTINKLVRGHAQETYKALNGELRIDID